MKTIQIKDIKTGDILFNCGKTWLAEQIKVSQEDKGNRYWYLNHVGVFLYQGDVLCVGEEDYPTNAKFPISNISIESLMPKSITIDLPIGTKFKQIRFAK